MRIPIITYRIHDVEPSKRLIRILGTQQWIDVFSRPQKPCLERLVQTIRWVTAGGDPPPPPPPPPPRWRKWVLAVAALLVVAAAVLVPLLVIGSEASDGTTATPDLPTTTTSAVPTAVWTELHPGGEQPPARRSTSMAYDSSSGKVIMFGGYDDGPLGDTWIYDSTTDTWTEVPSSDYGPSPWARAGMVYVEPLMSVILFGVDHASSGTWRFDVATNAWMKLERGGALPHSRLQPAMVYDWKHEKVIMFGGYWEGEFFDDTWVYDPAENKWTEVHPTGDIPSPRVGEGVWDSLSGRMIILGNSTNDAPFTDMWAFDLATVTWTEIVPTGVTPDSRDVQVIDSTSGQVIMFGGVAYGRLYDETWSYDPAGNTWTELDVVGTKPSARKAVGVAYDGSVGKVIMFGGYATGYLADTWTLSVE